MKTGGTEKSMNGSIKSLISIIIVTRNADRFLDICLQSIFCQSFKNIEIVVFDGESTDGTVEILEKYNDRISFWKSEPDNGIYDAMNKAVKQAKGNWLYFMGADDSLLPGFSEMAGNLKEDRMIYYGITEPADRLFTGKFGKYRMAKYCINHQAIFYPKIVFEKYNYNTRYKVYADYALNIKLWGDSSFDRKYFPVKIALYNMEGFSIQYNDELFKNEKPAIVKKSMGWLIYWRYMYKRRKELSRPNSNFF